VAVILGLGLYWFFIQKQPEKYRGPIEKITLAAMNRGAYALPLFIAQEQGYFAENGLEVTVKEYEYGLETFQAMLANQADIATPADFVVATYSFDYPDIRVLGTITKSDTNEIIARKDSGINKPGDLKGKRIGVTLKTIAEYFLGRSLTYYGLNMKDIQIIDLKPEEIIRAISKREIDAACIWDAPAYEIRKRLGAEVISWPAQAGQGFYCLVVSRDKWTKEHPQAIQRFLKAIIQAEEYIKRNPSLAKSFLERRFNCEASFVEYLWPKYEFNLSLPQELLLVLEDGAKWRIENKLTDKKEIPNYLEFIYMDALKDEAPEKVGIIR
jgi:NitT/TauT family transport system substrate-binding protein